MEEKHKEELRQRYRFIVNNVADAEAVCDELLSLGVFDENNIEKILLKKPAPKEQTKELLYLLKFRGAQAYRSFIVALERSRNQHVADQLLKPEVAPEQSAPTQARPEPRNPLTVPSQPQGESTQPQGVSTQPQDESTQPQPESRQYPPESTQSQPESTQTEDAFKSWPVEGKEIKIPLPCTEEEKTRLLSDETVYRITDFREKGFVLRLKCRQTPCEMFDSCNTCLANVMTFLDSPIKPGVCTTKLLNKSAAEYERNIEGLITSNAKQLEDAGYFMMFFLSFGAPGAGCDKVFDNTNQCVDLDNIMRMVKTCEALKDKPKIFIVITIPDKKCTVPEPPGGRDVTDAGEDRSSTNEDNIFVLHVSHGEQGPWIQEPTGKTGQMWFMKAFSDVFNAYSHNLHFLQLIEKVNKLLSNAVLDSKNGTRGHVGEVKVVQKDIRKKLFFFPGIKHTIG